MPRGDGMGGMSDELHFSDRDDEGEDLGGYGGGTGGATPYEDDDEEDGGWAITKDHSEELWDSTDEGDEEGDDEGEEGVVVAEVVEEEDDEEGDLFGAPRPARRGPGRFWPTFARRER